MADAVIEAIEYIDISAPNILIQSFIEHMLLLCWKARRYVALPLLSLITGAIDGPQFA